MTASAPERQGPMDAFRGDRVYLGADHARNERRTWIVAAICVLTLVAQIGGGIVFNSMALIGGGVHMGAHVAALAVAAGATAVTSAAANGAAAISGGEPPQYVVGDALQAATAAGQLVEILLRR